jgi:two-component system response regulator PilR (NtrC family)
MARILVVDDDESIRDVLTESITSLGHEVNTAVDGLDGVAQYKSGEYDVVITDLKMPRMDGLELLQEIKKYRKDTIILVITGYPTIDSSVQAIKMGAYDYITKPFRIEELEIVINNALERKMLGSQLKLFKGMFWISIFSIPLWIIIGLIWRTLVK